MVEEGRRVEEVEVGKEIEIETGIGTGIEKKGKEEIEYPLLDEEVVILPVGETKEVAVDDGKNNSNLRNHPRHHNHLNHRGKMASHP